MITFLRSRALAFKYAFSGCLFVFRTQKNTWIHSLATIFVILFAYWLKLSTLDWAVLIIVIGIVWTVEFVNTAIEVIIDLVSPQIHPLAKIGKDVGAAAVLVSAITSVLIGIIILGPPLYKKINLFFQ